MGKIRQAPIHTVEDVMKLLDGMLPMKVIWEPFYAEGKRTPPFLQNIPDENLVGYFEDGRIRCGRAIDLGCGIGRNAIFMARAGCRVDAVDLSETAISRAKAFARQEDVVVDFRAGSVFEMALPAAHFDIVYESGLLHHLQPHRRPCYLEMVCGMLKPEGRYGMTCFGPELAPSPEDWAVYESREMPPGIGYTEERLRAILEPHFEILEFRSMRELSADTGLFGMKGMWTVLMKPRVRNRCG